MCLDLFGTGSSCNAKVREQVVPCCATTNLCTDCWWCNCFSTGPAFEFLLDKMKGGWAWWQMVILLRKALVMICAMMFDSNAVLGWYVEALPAAILQLQFVALLRLLLTCSM